MTPKVRRLRATIAPWLVVSGLLIAAETGSKVQSADDPALPFGRWVVEARGFGWPSRLDSIEIRSSNQIGEPVLVAHSRGDDGLAKVWGTAKIDRKATGPSTCRWFSASWSHGSAEVVIQLRPEPSGRLLGLVRERSRDRGGNDRVRQVILTPGPTDERPVLDGPAPVKRPTDMAARFETEGSNPVRVPMTGVFVARGDGSEAKAVALPDGFATAAHPCWSPDGRWVAFAAFDESGRDPLIRIAPSLGGPSTAVAAGTTPTWSKDGSKIAYVASGRSVYATDWSTLGRNDESIESVTLSGPKAGEIEVLARGIWPRWSPADDRLAFVGRAEANWDIYVRSTDGLALSRLTDDPALDTQPDWTLDGRSIVFLSDRGNRWDLYRVATEVRGPAERLSNHVRREDNPSLSPDGRYVAFVDNRGRPESSIQILDLDRGTVRPFPAHSDGDRDPRWSPDGRSIAFISRRPGPLLNSGAARP